MSKIVQYIKDNVFAIVLCTSSIIYMTITRLFFDMGLTPDSTNYLREAKIILAGKGFEFNSLAGYEGFFGIWPIGYPLLIAIISKLFCIDVYYSALVITIFVYLIITYVFIKFFEKKAWIYLLFFCNPGFIYSMRMVSSENVFFLLVLFAGLFSYRVWVSKEDKYIWILGVVCLFSILVRWVGAFTISLSFILGIFYLFGWTVEQDIKKAIKLLGITILNGSVLVGYLFCVWKNTGYLTGMYRIPSSESRMELISRLIAAETMEVNCGLLGVFSVNQWVACIILLSFIFIFIKRMLMKNYANKLFMSCMATSLIYWVGYIYTRFRTDMETFNPRVLLPASLPFFIAVVSYLTTETSMKDWSIKFKHRKNSGIILCVLLVLMSFEIHNNCALKGKPRLQYENIKKVVSEQYQGIPSGALVITEDWCINFLRLDLIRTSVFACDSDQLPDIERALNNEKYKNIYIQKPYLEFLLSNNEIDERFSYFYDFLNQENYLIKIK